jgi:glucosamine--fructose-6-phosphate aminotransferase (isomerizing)
MCGIVGYVGPGEAQEFLLAGLGRLEYRGYDSAGLAVVTPQGIRRSRTVGRVGILEERLRRRPLPGEVGIGHTRWATHGVPSEENAHPHVDCSGSFAIVHNGILENHRELRRELVARGHRFTSETDTEVAVHLLEELYQGDLAQAMDQVARRLVGSYALVAITAHEPDRLVGVRSGNPLVVGLGEEENVLASDLPAVVERTRTALPLEDGDRVLVTRREVRVWGRHGEPATRKPFVVNWTPQQAEKGGYPHFLLKEILEQPQALRDTLAGRLDATRGRVELAELEGVDLTQVRRVRLVACGTSYHAALVGQGLLERLAQIPARAELASEFRYREPLLEEGEPCLGISQSGETLDTLEAMREAARLGHPTWAITNVLGSMLQRQSHLTLLTQAGPEISVASTKAFTSQILVLTLLAMALGQARGVLPNDVAQRLARDLKALPSQAQEVLERSQAKARQWGQRLAEGSDAYFLGRDLDWAVAMEGALKLKEISYIHAEGYAGGEMKHGPLALVEPGVPVVAVATQERIAAKILANAAEASTRGAWVTWVVREDLALSLGIGEAFFIPPGHDLTRPALSVLPLQLLAYEAAVARGTDVDRPRNLAKSVTVE